MDQFDRYFQLHRLLKSHRFPVSRAVIEERLEVSSATVKRIIRQLRNYGVPIEYNREQDGYTCQTGMAFELPGMWFSADELAALMTAHDLLANAAPGLLSETLSPLMAKLDALWKREHLGSGELRKRVRILRLAGRDPGDAFQLVCRALAERKRLSFDYDARTTGEASSRSVSPQRLTHYRDNWYLGLGPPEKRIAQLRSRTHPRRKNCQCDREKHCRKKSARALRQRLRHLRRQAARRRAPRLQRLSRQMGGRGTLASRAARRISTRWPLPIGYPLLRYARVDNGYFEEWAGSGSDCTESTSRGSESQACESTAAICEWPGRRASAGRWRRHGMRRWVG